MPSLHATAVFFRPISRNWFAERAHTRDRWRSRHEGRGFRNKVNRDYLMDATVLFLERHLLNGATKRSGTGELHLAVP